MNFLLRFKNKRNNPDYFPYFCQKRTQVGSKNKLKRFNENNTFLNVFQPKREELVDVVYPLKGQWNQQFFKNNNPLVLELGCGKGEYTVGLAQRYPNKNFIGIDIKGLGFGEVPKLLLKTNCPMWHLFVHKLNSLNSCLLLTKSMKFGSHFQTHKLNTNEPNTE